jgi:hypothetical protein
MEKLSFYSKILYIGFTAEKGRCETGNLWSNRYKNNLFVHLSFLLKIINEINNVITDNDITLLEEWKQLSVQCKEIGKFYLCYPNISNYMLLQEPIVFTHYNNVLDNNVNKLMLRMTQDILTILLNKKDTKMKKYISNKCKEKIYVLLCSLHNLPRCYLKKADNEFQSEDKPISVSQAIDYAINMNFIKYSQLKKFYLDIVN